MRAAIFIDGGYLLKRLQEAGLTPDYKSLGDFLLAPLRKRVPLDLLRCYFYYCPPWMSQPPTDLEKRRMAQHDQFVAELQDIDRWQVRLGKLEKRRDGDREVFAQKRVDVQLSVDLVRHAAAGHIQHAVILAGDSDFIPAVMAAKESGATVSIWCDRDTVHRDLMHVADEVQMIDLKQFPTRKERAAKPERPAPQGRAAAAPQGRTAAASAASSGSATGGRRRRSTAAATPPPAASTATPVETDIAADNLEAADTAGAEGGDGTKKKRRRGRRGGRGRRRPGGGGEGAD